jgi:hypothetical protein
MPWEFDADTEFYGCAALKLHTELFPLMYSLGYRNHLEGIQPVRPLYHIAPEEESAYNCPTAYLLGDDIIVSPFVTPIDKLTNVATTAVWLPPGDPWFDFQTGREYESGWHLISGDLGRIPVFVRAGGFLLMETQGVLAVHAFPCGSGRFDLYEDDGVSSNASFHITTFVSQWNSQSFAVAIESSGDRGAIRPNRKIVLLLHNISGDAALQLTNCELEARAAENAALKLTLTIRDYPATVRVSREKDIVFHRRGLLLSEIADLLRQSRLMAPLKKKLLSAIQKCSKSTEGFAEVIFQDVSIPEKFKEVLYGELADLGAYHFTKEMGQNVLVVWNSKQVPAFTYTNDFFREKGTPPHVRESGIVPPSLIYRIDECTTLHEHSHIVDFATRKMRLTLCIMKFPAFPFDFDEAK